MAVTSETAILELPEAQYLTFTAGAAITLGQVVSIGSTDGYAIPADSSDTKVIGVAVAGRRVSRTMTDNAVASGALVTVATRGVVNVTCTGTVTRGELVQTDSPGNVKTMTLTQYTDVNRIVGRALTTSTTMVKVLLNIC